MHNGLRVILDPDSDLAQEVDLICMTAGKRCNRFGEHFAGDVTQGDWATLATQRDESPCCK